MPSSKNDREARQSRERLRAYQARQAVHEQGKRRRRRDNTIAGIGIVVVAIIAVGVQLVYFGIGPGKPNIVPSASASATATPSPTATDENEGPVPSKTLADNATWTGTLTLNKDVTLGISLDGSAAPQAVSSTISLIEKGWYIGTLCHRLTTGATMKVLQCGGSKDLATAGSGGPGYSYGPIENAPGNGVYHKGVIAMANSGTAYSNGSQFFIVYGTTDLGTTGPGYSVIGKVTSGLDTLISDIADKGSNNSNALDDGQPKVATAITGFTIKKKS